MTKPLSLYSTPYANSSSPKLPRHPEEKLVFTSASKLASIGPPTVANYASGIYSPTRMPALRFSFGLLANAQHTRHSPAHQVGQEHGPDHQGHADGRRIKNAQGPASRTGWPPLCRADEPGAG